MISINNVSERFRKTQTCVIIPTYNNAKTLSGVIDDVLRYTDQVIVVNDGSTDETLTVLANYPNLQLLSYNNNVGKGWALREGFRRALKLGFKNAITIDSDGQHYAGDLPLFIEACEKNPGDLILGSRNIRAEGMSGKSTFANKFSNFWFWVETGLWLPDTQSGFRLYPIGRLQNMTFFTKKYEFEIEVMVRAEWNSVGIIPIPIRVYYPPESERVSHFRPMPDFTRISLLNTLLVIITVTLVWPYKLLRYLANNKISTIVKEQLSKHNESNLKVSIALGFGVFMGIIPIWGFQMLVAAFLAHLLRLNKILVLTASNISIPPLIPFIVYLSFELGKLLVDKPVVFTTEMMYYLKDQVMKGHFYSTLNEFGYSIFQYVLGSLVLAIGMGLLVMLISLTVLTVFKRSKIEVES
jgi:glycosyltransferase involved in cell wall biosynthesis